MYKALIAKKVSDMELPMEIVSEITTMYNELKYTGEPRHWSNYIDHDSKNGIADNGSFVEFLIETQVPNAITIASNCESIIIDLMLLYEYVCQGHDLCYGQWDDLIKSICIIERNYGDLLPNRWFHNYLSYRKERSDDPYPTIDDILFQQDGCYFHKGQQIRITNYGESRESWDTNYIRKMLLMLTTGACVHDATLMKQYDRYLNECRDEYFYEVYGFCPNDDEGRREYNRELRCE